MKAPLRLVLIVSHLHQIVQYTMNLIFTFIIYLRAFVYFRKAINVAGLCLKVFQIVKFFSLLNKFYVS